MKFSITLFLLLSLMQPSATAQDAKQLYENAKTLMKQGDYANASLALTKALALDPTDKSISKELALSYYYQGEYAKSLGVLKPLLEGDNGDEQIYFVAGNAHRGLNQANEASLVYRRGIVKMPQAGALYNALGEVMWEQKDGDAIKEWEKGIEEDPAYSKNYYNASKYYHDHGDNVWSILYGEIFLNMEPYSNRSPEIKDMLLESYKKLFQNLNRDKDKNNSKFESAYLQTTQKQSSIAGAGIDPESLMMIRTRFILDWFNENKRPAFKLFDYHRQLLQEGLFEAYNQWIFGSAQNLAYFQNWINAHPEEYAALTNFQKNRVFKIEPGEYYKK